MNIKDYGLKENLIKNIDEGKMIARIVATHRNRYEIVCDNGQGFARIKRGCYYDNLNSICQWGQFSLTAIQESTKTKI